MLHRLVRPPKKVEIALIDPRPVVGGFGFSE
jgi:hypothetical protein